MCQHLVRDLSSSDQNLFLKCFLLILSAVILTHILEVFSVDPTIQGIFFNPQTKSWFVDSGNLFYKRIFYSSPKIIIIMCGIPTLFYVIYKKFTQQDTPKSFIFVASIIAVPLILSSLKEITFVYCPSQLTFYGGEKSFRALFDFSEDIKWIGRGKCFPGGHASGGFALMSLYFVFQKRFLKIFGLALGLTLGWIMASYQVMKGAHFFSHSIASMLFSWSIILYIKYIYERYLSSPE